MFANANAKRLKPVNFVCRIYFNGVDCSKLLKSHHVIRAVLCCADGDGDDSDANIDAPAL